MHKLVSPPIAAPTMAPMFVLWWGAGVFVGEAEEEGLEAGSEDGFVAKTAERVGSFHVGVPRHALMVLFEDRQLFVKHCVCVIANRPAQVGHAKDTN